MDEQTKPKPEQIFRSNDESLASDEPLDEPVPKPMEHAKSMELKDARKAIEIANKKRTRRGYGKKNNRKNKKGIQNVKFSLLGTNSNGILGKLESLKSLINEFKPMALTIQETKPRENGSFKAERIPSF